MRAPRLRWSRPKYTPKRGTIRGTRRVRQSPKLEPRDPITRLGKIRGAILDVLDEEGRPMDINELAAALRRRRARDLRRRNLPMLEEAGIITVDDNVVSLADDWLKALDEARELGKEREVDEVARKRHEIKSKAYHGRHNTEPDHHYANVGADGFIEDLEPEELSPRGDTPEASVSPLAAAIRDYLDLNPGAVQEHGARVLPGWLAGTFWAYELYPGKLAPAEVGAAIAELGGERYLKDCLRRARGEAA